MRSLRINGLQTDAPYTTIGYFAGGPWEKFYRIFADMMIIVAYVYLCHGVTFM